MAATVTTTATTGKTWDGGNEPMGASYGKMMMWFFIVSDALTFSGFLAAYGFSRFKFIGTWPIADEVFTHFPFMHGVEAPMYYVALMTFILIFSSVTMVLAVDAGHHLQKTKVAVYMLLTIVGGFIFLGSQAWEWKNFIGGEFGAVETKGGALLQFVKKEGEEYKRVAVADFASHLPTTRIDKKRSNGIWFEEAAALPEYTVAEVEAGLAAHPEVLIRTENINPDTKKKEVLTREQSLEAIKGGALYVKGANLQHNEYGHKLFADFFFFITGFHGFHVFSGVVINILIFLNVVYGTYERRRSYEMVKTYFLYHFIASSSLISSINNVKELMREEEAMKW